MEAIRVLTNNAAHDERHLIEDVTPSFWRQRLAVNQDHQFFIAKAVVPGIATAGGAILNMGSCRARLGLGGLSAYVTAKAGIEGLTRGLARELGVRVNCIVPGFIKTERQVAKWLTRELERTVVTGKCLKELIELLEVAPMAALSRLGRGADVHEPDLCGGRGLDRLIKHPERWDSIRAALKATPSATFCSAARYATHHPAERHRALSLLFHDLHFCTRGSVRALAGAPPRGEILRGGLQPARRTSFLTPRSTS